MMRILMCEDEMEYMKLNKALLKKILKRKSYDIIAVTDMRKLNLNGLKNIDIAILDIDLGKYSGISIAKKILDYNKWAVIIFITGYHEFTMEAYKMRAFGYLSKPVREEEFKELLEKAEFYIEGLESNCDISVLSFCNEKNEVIIRQKDIIYIERVKRKLDIVTMKENYKANKTIKDIENELKDNFVKINQGTIVNMCEIVKIEKPLLYVKTGEMFRMSRAKIQEVIEQYTQFITKL